MVVFSPLSLFFRSGLFTQLTSLKLLANKIPSLQMYKFGKNNHLSFKTVCSITRVRIHTDKIGILYPKVKP